MLPWRTRACPKCKARSPRRDFNKRLQGTRPATPGGTDVIKTYVRLGFGVGIIAEMAKGSEHDEELDCIDASHLFPDSMIKIGFRHSRHIAAYQFDFLHMMTPYLGLDTIKELVHTKALNDRNKILQQFPTPSFRMMRENIKR